MRGTYIILLVFLLGFGCIEDITVNNLGNEQLLSTETQDIDGDGIPDYAVYTYGTFSAGELDVQRIVTVSTVTTAQYTQVDANLTDLDIYNIDQTLDEFSKSRSQADSACSENLGIMDFVCSDITTCTRLCSTASSKCRAIAETYDEALAKSIMTYVQDNGRLRSLILDSRRMAKELKEADVDEKNAFLAKTREMVTRIASINANPVYNHPELELCQHSDFGVNYIIAAESMVGNYSSDASSYEYTVLFTAKPRAKSDELGKEIISVGITDTIPPFVEGEVVTIHDTVDVTTETSGIEVSWHSKMPSEAGYLVSYEYKSAKPPEEMLASLQRPDISATKLDMSVLAPTNAVFVMVLDMTDNYFIALAPGVPRR